jgi:hypothetical protein
MGIRDGSRLRFRQDGARIVAEIDPVAERASSLDE